MILSNLGGLKSLKRYADLGRDGGYFEGLIEKGVAPGTVKSFLMGMQAFASNLELHTSYDMTVDEATAMKRTAQRWHASTSKLGAGRRDARRKSIGDAHTQRDRAEYDYCTARRGHNGKRH